MGAFLEAKVNKLKQTRVSSLAAHEIDSVTRLISKFCSCLWKLALEIFFLNLIQKDRNCTWRKNKSYDSLDKTYLFGKNKTIVAFAKNPG